MVAQFLGAFNDNAFKILISSLALTFVLGVLNFANAADIEVVFSDRLAKNMDTLNNIEREREEFFRETNDDTGSQRGRSSQFLHVAKLENVDWAVESLIPNVDDFTVERLIKAMAAETLKRADMGNLEGTIRLTIKTMKVANHSLSFLRGTDSYIIGTIEHIGANGQVLESSKVSANLVIDASVDASYSGPDFAFYATDSKDRIGPTLSRFIQKGLELLFKGRDFSGPIIIG